MPDQRRPGVVQHPLNHAGRGVFVARVSFKHGALAVIGQCLGFALVIIKGSRLAVTPVQTIGKNIHGCEPLATGVKIPYLIDGPEVILGNEFFQGFSRGNGRPRTCLRVIAVSAASQRIR